MNSAAAPNLQLASLAPCLAALRGKEDDGSRREAQTNTVGAKLKPQQTNAEGGPAPRPGEEQPRMVARGRTRPTQWPLRAADAEAGAD